MLQYNITRVHAWARSQVGLLAALIARGLPGFTLSKERGCREDRVRAAPAVSCATCTEEHAHEHTGSAESIRPSLRNGVTVYNALSPVNGSFATVAAQRLNPAQLDASTAASGVESRRGAVVAPVAQARFLSPLIKPDVRISRIRLSDWLHRKARGGRRRCPPRRQCTASSP